MAKYAVIQITEIIVIEINVLLRIFLIVLFIIS